MQISVLRLHCKKSKKYLYVVNSKLANGIHTFVGHVLFYSDSYATAQVVHVAWKITASIIVYAIMKTMTTGFISILDSSPRIQTVFNLNQLLLAVYALGYKTHRFGMILKNQITQNNFKITTSMIFHVRHVTPSENKRQPRNIVTV